MVQGQVLAQLAVPLTGLARLPYKQPLSCQFVLENLMSMPQLAKEYIRSEYFPSFTVIIHKIGEHK